MRPSTARATRLRALLVPLATLAGCSPAGERAQEPEARWPPVVRGLRIATPIGELAATLHLPDSPGPHPAVVMVQGAGTRTRGEWPYRNVAEHLASRGYAALIYDKRGTGDSAGQYDEAEDLYVLADDAVAAMEVARSRPEIDRDRVGLWGKSQGAWIITAAGQEGRAAFLILEVGGAVTGLEQNVFARQKGLEGRGVSAADRALVERTQRAVWSYYATGQGEADARAAVAAAREAGVLPAHVEAVPGVLQGSPLPGPAWVEGNADGMLRWFRRHLRFDPVPHLERQDVPVLALFGSADRLTPTEASVDRLRAAYGGRRSRLLTVRVYDGADHGLCPETPGELIVPECAFSEGYPEVLTEWLHDVVGRP